MAGFPRASLQVLQALQGRDFRYLWLGSAAGQLAYWVQLVAYGWLAYELTRSAAVVGLVSAATALPALVLTLPGGVLADRWNRRALLVWSQALLLLAATAMAALVVAGGVAPWHLAAAGAVAGLFGSINLPARQSLFPRLLPASLVADGVALFAFSFNLSRVVGPALAGALIGAVGAGGCFVFLAGCMAAATLGLALVGPERPRAGGRRPSLRRALPDALAFAWRQPAVRWLLALAAFQNAFGVVFVHLLPALAGSVLAVGGEGLGALLSATGIGATLGSLAAAALARARRQGDLALGSSLLFGLTLVGLGASSSLAWALVAAGVIGAALSITMTMNQTLMTLATPDELRGRVWSLHMLTWQLPLLAALPAGWIADRTGVSATIGAGGALVVALTLLAWLAAAPVRRFSPRLA